MLSNDTFAALSAVLTYMFLVGAAGLAVLAWRLRKRFTLWHEMGPLGRADTIFNFGLCGVLAVAGYHHTVATYHFALNNWSTAGTTAGVYLPLHIGSMACVLWWLCIELVGMDGGGRAWCMLMVLALAVGATMKMVF